MEEKAHDKQSTLFPHGNYSFLIFGIPKVRVHKCVESIQGRKLFKGENYSRAMRKYCKYFLRRDSLGKCPLSSMHRPL